MRGRRASLVVAGFVVALAGVVAAASPAAAGVDRGEGDERPLAVETSSASDGASQLQRGGACTADEHRCGAGPNFVCCEPTDQCCRHKGGVLYCAKKKCGPVQP